MSNVLSISNKPYLAINIRLFGKKFSLCLCHHLPERSIKFLGIENYLCARCFGGVCGFIPGAVILFLYPFSLWVSILLVLPMIVDGSLQALTKYESTNPIRFITGFLFGIGGLSLVVNIIDLIRSLFGTI